jgi:hypothetical protein
MKNMAKNKKGFRFYKQPKNLFFITRLAGVEPATYGFLARTLEFSNLLILLKLLENRFFILADFPYIPRFSSFRRKSPTESPTVKIQKYFRFILAFKENYLSSGNI